MEAVPGPSSARRSSARRTVSEKNIILRVFNCLKRDHPNRLKDGLVDMCSDYTGASKASVYKILKEEKVHGKVQPPKVKTGTKKIEVNEDIIYAIRRIVHDFFRKNELPTLKKMMEAIWQDGTIPKMSKETFRKILHNVNFTFGKVDRKSILIERYEIVLWRREYLTKIRDFRKQGRKIYYTDETWVNEGHTVKKVWQDMSVKNARQAAIEGWSTGLRMPSGKGRRLIITHIGSDSGFLLNGELIFQSKKTGDYHEEMNSDVYEKWFGRILENLEPGSVVVMDNAPYHSRKCELTPQQSWRKERIREWLRDKGITYDETSLKAELLHIVKMHAHKFKKLAIDELALSRGINVLRLPPYHCELNPIELIWAQIKGSVAKENRTFKLADVYRHLQEAIENVTPEEWRKCIDHVKKEEQKMWDVDNLSDEMIDPIIISVGNGNNSDSEADSD